VNSPPVVGQTNGGRDPNYQDKFILGVLGAPICPLILRGELIPFKTEFRDKPARVEEVKNKKSKIKK
jgi:hypothetical protein